MGWKALKIDLFTVSDTILGGANTEKIRVNVWEKVKVWCPIGGVWLTFLVFYELQETDTQQKAFLVKFEEHRFPVRWGIALLIFHTNVWENENLNWLF